jgi:hypothetical protein
MALGTFVSVEADFPTWGMPPGRELAGFISSVLTRAAIPHSAPEELKGWAWTIRSQSGHTRIESIIGFSDDGPRQWQIHTYGYLGILDRLLRRGAADPEALRGFCEAIDRAIKSDGRFRTIRWYEQETYETDFGDTWDDAP